MPELPEIELYLSCLGPRVLGRPLAKVRLRSFFFVRSAEPPVSAAEGRELVGLSRLGKRIVLSFAGDLHFVVHLMVTGRLLWRKPGAGIPGRHGLAALDFPDGTLLVVEYGTRKKAALHVVEGARALAAHDPGGVEPLGTDPRAFRESLARESHTLKRALADPRLLAGVGNAMSDEILHRARLSPFRLTGQLDDGEWARLHAATGEVLAEWTARLREETGGRFPEKLVAAKPGMAVHGRYREPCPECGAPVQRVVFAESEMNYCARCQTGGKLLADRALSRLLRDDWPGTIDELA